MGVKNGKTFPKWGNLDEKLLNGVISVQNGKLGGKKRNSLFILKTMPVSLHRLTRASMGSFPAAFVASS
jgi:hypothetical protein